MLLAIDFTNLHEILQVLYQDMMPLCEKLTGVAKGIAGLGALFYVAAKVWQAIARAEPIDVYPLLRPFAIGLCIIMFPTVVLGTVNAVLSPVVQGTHAILEGQTTDIAAYQKQRDDLEYEARVREGKAWLADDEVYDQQLAELGIMDLGEIISMWWERTWHGIKTWFRELVRDFFELLFNAAGLTVDTLRTFFLVVLSILGPLSFALSVYDGFQGTLTHWLSKYICVYLWLPVADLFSAVLAKIQVLMLQADIAALQDPSYIPDGSNGVYIIFLIIGIIGYFTVPTAAEWIVQAGGGSGLGGVNRASSFAAGVAGGVTGALIGKAFGRGDKSKYGEQDLKARARLKTEEFSEQAVQFGQEVREKAVEFGRDTRKKGEKFYQQKSDEIADDIEEKTKRIQEELRNTGSEIYKDTSKRFNSAADDAAKEILDQ